MALPHYKLYHGEPTNILPPEQFPFLLVPNESSSALHRIRNFFLSKFLLQVLGTAICASGGTLIWLSFEPARNIEIDGLKFSTLLIPASILGGSLLLLVIIAILKARADKPVEESLPMEIPQMEIVPLAPTHNRSHPNHPIVEWRCEEWATEQYIEVLDDAVIAEIFPDEMMAPDRMIFSFEIKESGK